MNKERIEKVAQHVDDKWKDKDCLLCGENGWGMAEVEIACIPWGRVLPLVASTCGNCGNTVFINAVVAGVHNQEEQHGVATPVANTARKAPK